MPRAAVTPAEATAAGVATEAAVEATDPILMVPRPPPPRAAIGARRILWPFLGATIIGASIGVAGAIFG
jgi:hypothetical protein